MLVNFLFKLAEAIFTLDRPVQNVFSINLNFKKLFKYPEYAYRGVIED